MPVRLLIPVLFCWIAVLPGCDRVDRDRTALPPPSHLRLTSEEFDEAQQLLRRGIAHLENKNWAASEIAFQALNEQVTDNTTVLQNLAILRVLAVIDRTSALQRTGAPDQRLKFSQSVDRARTAVDAWRDVSHTDDTESLADLLAGKLLVHADRPDAPSFEEGLRLLRQAATRQPQRPDLSMAVAQAMLSQQQQANSPELLQQLLRTCELAPENLYALQLLLQQQAMSLGASNAETANLARQTIRSTIETAITLLEPLNNSVLSHARIDMMTVMQNALMQDAADAGNLTRPAMLVANAIKAEIPVQIDRRRIDRHLLNYVQPRFEEAILSQYRPTTAAAARERSVLKRFRQQNTPVAGLTDVTDVRLADMTLDGKSDLIVAHQGHIEVYMRPDAESSDWSLAFRTSDSSQHWTSFQLADIDRDYDPRSSALTRPIILEDRDQDRRITSEPEPVTRRIDTDPDLIAWNPDALQILRNTSDASGQRTLEPVQLVEFDDITDVVPADADADGDLDLFVATLHGIWLLTNTNGSAFLSRPVSPQPVDRLAVGDVDRNIAIDVAGISDHEGPGLLQNLFHGRYRWLPSDDLFGPSTVGSAIALGDFDGNLSWDIVCAGTNGIVVHLTRTTAPGFVAPLTTIEVSDSSVNDMQVADLDNDGCPDIAALTASGLETWRGIGDGTFIQLHPNMDGISGSALESADFDDDGDLDLLIIDETASLQLLINDGGNLNHWMKIVVRGRENDDQFRSQRVNMHGIGTVLEVMAGSVWQAHIVTEPVVHVGLGGASRLDAVRLIWPNGVPQNIVTDQLLRSHVCILAPQILKGSCPYIYSWTGRQFEFLSDCLWSAPIGLVQASGDLAPTREWEHLLISGDRLVARDGEYVLQITEELWEIAYFDDVRLFAVDHPPGVRIFTNEKVGPPDLAAHRIHTVRHPRLPKSIVDRRGNDLLPALSHQDGNYAQAFEARQLQGLTDEWTMEFDLGLIDTPDNIRLFLTGWVFPTDTSLNLQIHQNPDISPPAPPSIEIPHADGSWKQVAPFVGFPGGKTKTMVVDLTDVLRAGDSRFRIRSSMELYFDHIFFTAGEPEEPTTSHPCDLVAAGLHDRGFSRRNYAGSVFRGGQGPEGYDYGQITTEPRWPPVSGTFTRYGAVESLIRDADDHLVVLGPGDELTLRFAVPETPVPNGWTRDFVLRNTGWDKDADLNTVCGQSTEPYPFRAMSQYPFADTDRFPDSSEYRSYRAKYQTREYPPHKFWGAVRNGHPQHRPDH